MSRIEDDASRVAHLYRRAGFGARPDQVEVAAARGYEASVEALLDFGARDPSADVPVPRMATPEQFTSKDQATRQAARTGQAADSTRLRIWWLQRMYSASNPLPEKLALFWHGHFATSVVKVHLGALMYQQNQLFRSLGNGPFEALAQAVAKDPAMLIWLDSRSNRKGHPNENFGRELLELFTLGHGNYSEDDVRQAARCFTGWTLDPVTYQFQFDPSQHDDGVKTVLGNTGNLGGEDVVNAAVHLPASSGFIVAKAWSFFAWPVTPADPIVADLAKSYSADRPFLELLRAIFLHPLFTSDQARNGLIKPPVDFVVGALRALNVKPTDDYVLSVLKQFGQVLFGPPNVAGWPQNGYWVNTASTYTRLQFATAIVARGDISSVEQAPRANRPDAAARLLSIDQWSSTTRAALDEVADNARVMVPLALAAPENVLA